mgnify:FL=1
MMVRLARGVIEDVHKTQAAPVQLSSSFLSSIAIRSFEVFLCC